MSDVIDLTLEKTTETEDLKAENKKLKRLLIHLMGKADFDHDGDTILIYHDTRENGDLAYEAMKKLGVVFCEKYAEKMAEEKAREAEADKKAKKPNKRPKTE